MTTRPDLTIIVVSHNSAAWLPACLTSAFDHAGDCRFDVVVVDSGSTDGTRELVISRFPDARVVSCSNRGFAHANNRALETNRSRYVLFLNPDTEIRQGTFSELVGAMDDRPDVGLIGVKQISPAGELLPSIRRFPSAVRALGEALASERWPFRASWTGERELDPHRYELEVECDWTSGSFMLARREALLSAGFLDERFFMYSEEPDLCLRMRHAGWRIAHLPTMTIVHHAGKGGVMPRMVAQDAFARKLYARKHLPIAHRTVYLSMVAARHVVRAAVPARRGSRRRQASQAALRTLAGLATPPFGPPPATAVPDRRRLDAS